MFESYIFEIPAKFQAAHDLGQLTRYGSLLKDSGTGRIVAHLQETGAAQSMLGSMGSFPLAPVSAVSSLVGNIQLVKMQQMLEVMQVFQFATLGATIAGIGVSAAGFALVNRKLNILTDSVTEIAGEIRAGFQAQADSRIRDMISLLKGKIKVAEHSFDIGAPASEWDRLGKEVIEIGERFRAEIEYLLHPENFNEQLFDVLLNAICLSNSTAGKAFLLAEDYRAASRHADAIAKQYNELFDEISPLSFERMLNTREHGLQGSSERLTGEVSSHARQKVAFIRDIQESANTAPLMLECLETKQISGRDYVGQVIRENRSPIVLLEA